MYVEVPIRLSTERCAELVTLSRQLDVRPGPGGSRATDPEATRRLYEPVLGRFFPGVYRQIMLMLLYPSSQIVGHVDPPIPGTRYHVPVQTNDGCFVLHGGCWQRLRLGQGYSMDPTIFHGAVNWGHDLRMHLIVDTL
jgi:hypothetical protein